MPELPDVETWKRYVDSTSLRRRIDDVHVDAPRMLKGIAKGRLAKHLKGQRFSETARHGKFLFVHAGRPGWLILHFGMTGFLRYGKPDPDKDAKARLRIGFAGGTRLAGFWPRRLGRISWTESPERFVEATGLGPDPLAAGMDRKRFVALFRERNTGYVKSALMDQGFIAGIGNVYSDEMLFRARLHPRTKLADLGDGDLGRLHRAMLDVLRVAIGRQADPENLPRSWLLPRRKKGASCPRCGGKVQAIKAAGRTAYFCPGCQEPG